MELHGEWTAIHDHMPGKPKTLTVSGQVSFRSGGWRTTLTRSDPQGFNPRILLLDLTATQDGDVQVDALSTVDTSYSEASDGEYDEATIKVIGTPEGDAIEDKTVAVQIVH